MSRKLTGCRNFRIAKLLKNGYGAFMKVEDLESVTTTKVYAEAKNFADNIQNIYKKALKSITIDTEFSDIKPKTKAIVQGKAYEKGGVLTTTDDIALPIAIAFERTYDDGTAERVVYYKATLYEKDINSKTEGESIDFTSQGFAGSALPYTNTALGLKNAVEYTLDNGSEDSEFDQDKFDNFFDYVQLKGTVADVEVSYTATDTVSDISVNGITFVTDKFDIPATYKDDFTFKDGTSLKTATYSENSDTWTIA